MSRKGATRTVGKTKDRSMKDRGMNTRQVIKEKKDIGVKGNAF